MRIQLITHAHTEQLPEVAVDIWSLSRRGVEQAERLANAPFWGTIDRIVVSSEPKTWLTVAKIVAQRNLPVWIDSRFDELRRAGWTEDYSAHVAAVFASPTSSIAGWESVESVRERVLTGLAHLKERFAGEELALVGHGICLSVLRAEALRSSTVDFSEWRCLAFGSSASILFNPLTLIEDFEMSNVSVR